MFIGKSIRIYLADATVTGVRYAELVNWTGHAIACPRNKLNELMHWSEAAKPGVYFLFEGRYGDEKPSAYVGESENVMLRLISHDRNKEFWNEVIVFTSKDENLTKAHIKYLESGLVALAKKADRYMLQNGNTPTESSLPRADRDAMEEFIANVRMVLGVLGHPIFEPMIARSSIDTQSGCSTGTDVETLYFSVNGLKAEGLVTDEGFVIKKGSQASKNISESMPNKVANIRDRWITDGVLYDEAGYYLIKEDILLSSSSYAAALIAGTSRSGPQSWQNAKGVTLKQIEDKTFESTQLL